MEPDEMRPRRLPLDDATAGRLMAGDLAPSDAPPGYEGAARLLAEAGTTADDAPPDEAFLAAMVQAIQSSPADVRTPSVITRLRSAKVATLAAAVVLSTAGAAAAATGNLPDPAQDALHRTGRHLGIDVPAGDDDGADHDVTDDRGTDDPATHDVTDDQGTDDAGDDHGADDPADHDAGDDHGREDGDDHGQEDGDRHGDDVSKVARETEPGPDHGATVSSVAKDNRGHGSDTTTSSTSTTSTTVTGDQGRRGPGGDDAPGQDAADDHGGRGRSGSSDDD